MHIKSLDEAEFARSMSTLSRVEQKIEKSDKLHSKFLGRRVSQMKTKNQQSMTKLEEYKRNQDRIYKEKCIGVLKKEEKDMKRLDRLEKNKRQLMKNLQKTLMENTIKQQAAKGKSQF